MTNEQLKEILDSNKHEEWHKGFFYALNMTPGIKAAFLRELIGQEVSYVLASEEAKKR
jgi:hypothetical protein